MASCRDGGRQYLGVLKVTRLGLSGLHDRPKFGAKSDHFGVKKDGRSALASLKEPVVILALLAISAIRVIDRVNDIVNIDSFSSTHGLDRWIEAGRIFALVLGHCLAGLRSSLERRSISIWCNFDQQQYETDVAGYPRRALSFLTSLSSIFFPSKSAMPLTSPTAPRPILVNSHVLSSD